MLLFIINLTIIIFPFNLILKLLVLKQQSPSFVLETLRTTISRDRESAHSDCGAVLKGLAILCLTSSEKRSGCF